MQPVTQHANRLVRRTVPHGAWCNRIPRWTSILLEQGDPSKVVITHIARLVRLPLSRTFGPHGSWRPYPGRRLNPRQARACGAERASAVGLPWAVREPRLWRLAGAWTSPSQLGNHAVADDPGSLTSKQREDDPGHSVS